MTNTGTSSRCHLVSTLVALSFHSYIGETLRLLTGDLFGSVCHDPDSVSVIWKNASSWVPCTTDPGTTESTGGALFTDLPANMLGCFLMGLLVAGNESLGIPVDMNVCAIKRSSFFQNWRITHMAMRTGLCGSLTTFASWNTQMVKMLCNRSGSVLPSQWVSVMFGYTLGWMAAVESYKLGRDVAVMIHRVVNPDLRRDADALAGKIVNRDLPDLERRYLNDVDDHNITMEDDESYKEAQHHLQQWKEKSQDRRLQQRYSLMKELFEIERAIVVQHQEPRTYLLQVAEDAGWNISGLKMYAQARATLASQALQQRLDASQQDYNWTELWFHAVVFTVATALFLWGSIVYNGSDTVSIKTRSFFLSALLAPFGTLLRWKLSRWNGSISNPQWEWLPIGTYSANMLASCISCAMAATSLQKIDSPIALSFVGAIGSGFAGSLSTVSTMVVESVELLKALPQRASGYYYSMLTLVSATILGIICYIWAVV